MKNKGFTLVELLAVIIILAVVIMILAPTVLKTINKSRSEANEISVNNYIKAVEQKYFEENLENNFEPNVCYVESNGNLLCDDIKEEIKIEVDGARPESGLINFDNGKVVYYDITLNEKQYTQFPYTDYSCFEYVDYYQPNQINEYYEIADYNKCIEKANTFSSDSATIMCSSAGSLVMEVLGFTIEDLLEDGIIKEKKELSKDTIYNFKCFNQDIIIPYGTKTVNAVTDGTPVKKVILPSTVTYFNLYGSYMTDVIVPNGVKTFMMGVTNVEKLILPSSIETLELSGNNYNLTSITIKNSKENVTINSLDWKEGSECAKWTGDIKDNPCIHWVY
ncbi:MAG: type II secretion system protein [Bacilli bacterium]|nr:type II secretion system protein [Bacilli bacterium]